MYRYAVYHREIEGQLPNFTSWKPSHSACMQHGASSVPQDDDYRPMQRGTYVVATNFFMPRHVLVHVSHDS